MSRNEAEEAQALVSFKVNICPFPLPHFASIFFTYL
jgi:hypothetical protein